MIELIQEMFQYGFIRNAMLVGILVSLSAAPLGVSLVLKRYSMIGDGLSHVGFAALALATAFPAISANPLTISVPIVVVAAIFLLRISSNSKIKGDAAIAMISIGSLAVGVMIISKTTGMNTDVCKYMFGSILAMSKSDVNLSIALSVVVLVAFVLLYNKIFAVTFDETFARATGSNAGLYNMMIAVLTALVIVLGMRLMGALLISGLVIFPALTAMRVCKRFGTTTLCAVAVSALSLFLGVTASYVYDFPTGAWTSSCSCCSGGSK